MPIKFSLIGGKHDCTGGSWTITDDDALAELIARVALGQSRYVRRVLRETGFAVPDAKETELAGALKLLTSTDPKAPWHRDGWMFQVISWIAARLQNPQGLIAPPHMIHAHKGFDGLHVTVDPKTSQVTSVVICEEKATENARKMVRDRIWKEFQEMQNGTRDNELAAEVTRLLETAKGVDVDAAVETIVWKNARYYRIAITIDEEHKGTDGYRKLFDGYDVVVAGDVARRRGEVLYLSDMRAWMAKLAQRAAKKANAMVAVHV
ncbi:hypothetical protein ACQR1Y_14025 [Bradyrhizobium sp. HKCCYLRH3099]|uniref:hypothetical protein n=1 Tax=unclassified Bradyrhizobium TaxID=2631580 RepID=UPI003EBFCCD1